MGRYLGILCLLAAAAHAGDDGRDGTQRELGERFCGKSVSCRNNVMRVISQGKTVQEIILSLGDAIYEDNPQNAERAYDAMTRSLRYAQDFLSDDEMAAGQTIYVGGEVETLRAIFLKYASFCELRNNWLAKYQCVHKRISAFLPR
jgi:hypothetical protein